MAHRFAAAALACALATSAAGDARAYVRTLGETLADDCAKAAVAGRADRKTLRSCTQSIEDEPLSHEEMAYTRMNRGVLYMLQRRYSAALIDFNRAIQLEPSLAEAYVARGLLHSAEGRHAQALADMDRGLSLGVRAPEQAYFKRAVVREQAGDVQGAWADYRRAAELAPAWEAPRRQLKRFRVSGP